MKEEDEATHYEDARTGEGRRRLSVCARDLYRLVDRFHGTTAAQLEEYRLLERLLREQCHVGKHQDGRPRDDDDDAGECKVPVALKDPKQVSADSLQSPHDPDVTYSGHKGKGYEVQVAETCHEENATQLITHVEVTPSTSSLRTLLYTAPFDQPETAVSSIRSRKGISARRRSSSPSHPVSFIGHAPRPPRHPRRLPSSRSSPAASVSAASPGRSRLVRCFFRSGSRGPALLSSVSDETSSSLRAAMPFRNLSIRFCDSGSPSEMSRGDRV